MTFIEETKITLYDGINIIIKMTSMLTQSDITSCRLNSISYHKKKINKIITEMDIQMNYFLIITKKIFNVRRLYICSSNTVHQQRTILRKYNWYHTA